MPLLSHFYHFFLQVLLGRVLDVDVVALGAGEVTAYTLREEIGHHSLPQQAQMTGGKNKSHAFYIMDTQPLPYRPGQQIPSSFPSTPAPLRMLPWRNTLAGEIVLLAGMLFVLSFPSRTPPA